MVTSLRDLVNWLELDLNASGGFRIVADEGQANDEYLPAPLVVAVSRGKVRVTVGAFSGGQMRPGRSVTFDSVTGVPIEATTDAGKREDDLQRAIAGLWELINARYVDPQDVGRGTPDSV